MKVNYEMKLKIITRRAMQHAQKTKTQSAIRRAQNLMLQVKRLKYPSYAYVITK